MLTIPGQNRHFCEIYGKSLLKITPNYLIITLFIAFFHSFSSSITNPPLSKLLQQLAS